MLTIAIVSRTEKYQGKSFQVYLRLPTISRKCCVSTGLALWPTFNCGNQVIAQSPRLQRSDAMKALPFAYIFATSLYFVGTCYAYRVSTANSSSDYDFGLKGFAAVNPLGRTTGGDRGRTVTATSPAALASAVKGSKPLTIIVRPGAGNSTKRIRVGSNKSIIGAGAGVEISGAGFQIQNVDNVIIRNLKISFVKDNDGITIQNSTRVWIDHCEFESNFSEAIGPDKYVGR